MRCISATGSDCAPASLIPRRPRPYFSTFVAELPSVGPSGWSSQSADADRSKNKVSQRPVGLSGSSSRSSGPKSDPVVWGVVEGRRLMVEYGCHGGSNHRRPRLLVTQAAGLGGVKIWNFCRIRAGNPHYTVDSWGKLIFRT